MPRYLHQCPLCIYLGEYQNDPSGTTCDLYFCAGNLPTVIARYTDDGPDYSSGICFDGVNPAITEGCRLAREKGLLNADNSLNPAGVEQYKRRMQ